MSNSHLIIFQSLYYEYSTTFVTGSENKSVLNNDLNTFTSTGLEPFCGSRPGLVHIL